MFFEWLERQRAKPESERRFMAISLSFVLTGVIALGWLSSLLFEAPEEAAPQVEAPQELEGSDEVRSAFELIGERFRDFRDAITEGFPSSIEYEQLSTATTTATTSDIATATSTATTTSR